MKAAILVGHGSLRKASGAAMIRLAALLRKEGDYPLATAGFLNFSKPTFLDAMRRCVRKGASEIFVQPYFLISGYYVTKGLPKLVAEARAEFPDLPIHVADAFDYHPALAQLVMKRAGEAEGTALLLMAHGSPFEAATAPIFQVAETLRQTGRFSDVRVSFMELNAPTIAEAVDALVAGGAAQVVAVPYFLQLGGHVAEDLPEEIEAAQVCHPKVSITLTEYLSYDPLLLEVVRARLNALRTVSVS